MRAPDPLVESIRFALRFPSLLSARDHALTPLHQAESYAQNLPFNAGPADVPVGDLLISMSCLSRVSI